MSAELASVLVAMSVLLQGIPTLVMPKWLFVVINYVIIAVFIVMNIYITYEIVRAYGPGLTKLFREGA